MVKEVKRGAAKALLTLAQKVSLHGPVDEAVWQSIAMACADPT